ncbi:MAG TPA: hypothetical protein VMG08_16625 [Allosphingosinicella sp.]|nr:hypothetical protein [Allosphingosinicella sp.]
MKPVQLLALFLILGCAPAPAQEGGNAQSAGPPAAPNAADDAEREAIMDRIEREIRLPAGADPLASYERSYAWQERGDGVRKVIGVYLTPEGSNRGRRWVTEAELPLILDGGCSLVSLSYDVAAGRIDHVTCNGEA